MDEYWNSYVAEVVVNNVKDDDSELLQLQKSIWEAVPGFVLKTQSKKKKTPEKPANNMWKRTRKIIKPISQEDSESNSSSDYSASPIQVKKQPVRKIRTFEPIEEALEEEKKSEISEDE